MVRLNWHGDLNEGTDLTRTMLYEEKGWRGVDLEGTLIFIWYSRWGEEGRVRAPYVIV